MRLSNGRLKDAALLITDAMKDIYSIEDTKGNFLKRAYYKYEAKRLRNRLLDSIHKMDQADVVLDSEELYFFFGQIYNSYPPNGSFGNIRSIIIQEDPAGKDGIRLLEATIKFDNIVAKLSFHTEHKFSIDFKVDIEDGKTYSYNSELKRLSYPRNIENSANTSNDIRKYILQINQKLMVDIMRFMTSLVDPNKEELDESEQNQVLRSNSDKESIH